MFVSSRRSFWRRPAVSRDVSAALPEALSSLGVDVHLLLPGYPKAIASMADKSVEVELADFMGAGPMRLISARTPDISLPIWLVTALRCFSGPGPVPDDDGQDWPDNALRFALFNHVAARLSLGLLLAIGGPTLSMPTIGMPGCFRRSWPARTAEGLRQSSRCTTLPIKVCFPPTSIPSSAFPATASSRTGSSSMARSRSSKPASATVIV